eukprot:m.39120 g.39120  ORF g.39120 m.39120 type:complete len:207 (+) comp10266_c0_seq1:397-1017(+)
MLPVMSRPRSLQQRQGNGGLGSRSGCVEWNLRGRHVASLDSEELAVARRLRGFDVGDIVYFGRRRKTEAEKTLNAQKVSLDELLVAADIVIVTCALTEDTTHILDSNAFKKMKPTAIVVNTARGGCIDQNALVDALTSQRIAAAGLDVTTPEPLPILHPLFKLDNCVITPHIGSATSDCRRAMAMLAVNNMLASLTGKEMPARVNV